MGRCSKSTAADACAEMTTVGTRLATEEAVLAGEEALAAGLVFLMLITWCKCLRHVHLLVVHN